MALALGSFSLTSFPTFIRSEIHKYPLAARVSTRAIPEVGLHP